MEIDLNSLFIALLSFLTVVVTTVGGVLIAKQGRINTVAARTETKIDEVHKLANSNLTDSNKRLDDALTKINVQGTMIGDLTKMLTNMDRRNGTAHPTVLVVPTAAPAVPTATPAPVEVVNKEPVDVSVKTS